MNCPEIKSLKKGFDNIDYELNEIQKNSSEGIDYKQYFSTSN